MVVDEFDDLLLVDPSIERSLYVHVPFCQHRCGYCNFTLVSGRDYLIEKYLDAIAIEIDQIGGHPRVNTVFFGGGTPSYLNGAQFEKLSQAINRKFDLTTDCEVTCECNPSDLDHRKRDAFAAAGVNRISLGIQSFEPDKLRFLERNHGPRDIEEAIETAKSLTANVSFDLIFGANGETISEWKKDLESAIEFEPQHLSTYELTIEKGTQFFNRQLKNHLKISSEETRIAQYESTIEILTQNDFQHYEISSFSRAGFQCLHNLAYWSGKEYFAIGPGAACFLNGVRKTNHRSTSTYIKKLMNGQSPAAEREKLSVFQQSIDQIVFGLRGIGGIPLANFVESHGFCPVQLLESNFSPFFEQGFLTVSNSRLKLTKKGVLFYDSIAAKILNTNFTPMFKL